MDDKQKLEACVEKIRSLIQEISELKKEVAHLKIKQSPLPRQMPSQFHKSPVVTIGLGIFLGASLIGICAVVFNFIYISTGLDLYVAEWMMNRASSLLSSP